MFCFLSSLYKKLVFLSNLVQSILTILGTCSKILFKKSILEQILSVLFSSSKSFSFSVQKYFSILRPLSFIFINFCIWKQLHSENKSACRLVAKNFFLILCVVISPFLTEILTTSLMSALVFCKY